MNSALAFFLAATIVSVFSFISVVVWAENRRKEREAYYRSEVLKKLSDSQVVNPSPTMEVIREHERVATAKRREGYVLGGLINTGIGIGLGAFLKAVSSNTQVYFVGFIPLFIGLALLVYVYLLAPKQ